MSFFSWRGGLTNLIGVILVILIFPSELVQSVPVAADETATFNSFQKPFQVFMSEGDYAVIFPSF